MKYKKQIVQDIYNADTSRLYGTLDEAIQYLKELKIKHPNASLGEHWTGYEDMTFSYFVEREETDQEFEIRVKQHKAKLAYEAEEAERARVKAAKFEQLRKLKAELGVY